MAAPLIATGIKVHLTKSEMYHAELIAKVRQRLAEREGRPDTYAFNGDGLHIHTDGCYAEIAVARVLNLYWHALLDREERKRLPDVGADIGVRACADQFRQGRQGGLFVHKEDHDEFRYMLVDGAAPDLLIVGWMLGVDAKQDKWWRTGIRKEAYLIKREYLVPM